jgi:hypothetical protein
VNTNLYKPDMLKEVMNKENLAWRSFADVRGEKDEGFPGPIADGWNLTGTPTLYLLDHKGVVRYHWVDGPSTKVIDDAIAKLIKEAEEDGKKERLVKGIMDLGEPLLATRAPFGSMGARKMRGTQWGARVGNTGLRHGGAF